MMLVGSGSAVLKIQNELASWSMGTGAEVGYIIICHESLCIMIDGLAAVDAFSTPERVWVITSALQRPASKTR